MEINRTTLRRLGRNLLTIQSERKEEITIEKPLPYTTGYAGYRKDAAIPAYLQEFANLYEYHHDSWGNYFQLKDECVNDCPTYKITVTKYIYDVEFNERGKDFIAQRYAIHARCLNFYANLVENMA